MRVEEILKVADPDDRETVRLLDQSVKENRETYKRRSTKANLDNWEAAEKKLNEKICDLKLKYFPNSEFQNVKQAINYLTSNGFKISDSTFYNHITEGRIKRRENQTFLKKDLDAYANNPHRPLPRLDGSKIDSDEKNRRDLANELLRERIRKQKIQNDKDEGKLVEIDKAFLISISMLGQYEARVIHLANVEIHNWSQMLKKGKLELFREHFRNCIFNISNELANSEKISVIFKNDIDTDRETIFD